MQRGPDVLIHANTLVGAPEEAAAEEAAQEKDAVVPLGAGAGHVELVEEPVEVQEGGGEFIEDECWAVEIEERALGWLSAKASYTRGFMDWKEDSRNRG